MILDPQLLLQNTLLRNKLWTWTEIHGLTQKLPSEIINTKFEAVDPLFVLPFSKKNYHTLPSDFVTNNYLNSSNFDVGYNNIGVSQNYCLSKSTPNWAFQIQNDDWYWKTKWLAKNGSIIIKVPGIKSIYLGCSTASRISNSNSDLDIMVEVWPGFVWISKIYLAIISKFIKYYDFNFVLGLFYYFTNQRQELLSLKKTTLENKIKIDFGLVFENWKDVYDNYPDKERNFFIYNCAKLNPEYDDLEINSIAYYESKWLLLLSNLVGIIEWFFLPFAYIIGILNYRYEIKTHKNNINMVIKSNIYSQYNLIY
jgi:hypothetical protein